MADEHPTDRLDVGYIGKAHGLRGEVAVRLTTDRTERLDPGHELFADGQRLVVASARRHQHGWLVCFEGVTDRTGAEALRGSTLAAAPIDDPDAIWVHDLIGAPIEELDGTPRGIIETVQENPASDLLVLESGALVPLTFFVEQRSDRTVVVDVPAGLFDLGDPDDGGT